MAGDDLASELLGAALGADPLAASLYGIPGYDALLPDFTRDTERAYEQRLSGIATRAEDASESGLGETDLQTLDFVR